MSNYRISLIAALSAIAFCVGSTSPAWAQSTVGPGAGSTQQSSSSSTSEPSTTSSTRASSTTPDSTSDATTSSAQATSQRTGSASSSTTEPSLTTSGSSTTRTYGVSETGTGQKSMQMSQGHIRIATEEDENRKVSDFKGQTVTGSDGKEIGSVDDFVINKGTGKVEFMVVASGGFLGIGESLRLVAHDSLEPMAAAEGFSAKLDEVAFEALPVVRRSELEAGRIPADIVARVQSQKSGAGTTETSAQEPATIGTAQAQEHALASQLAGIDVRSGTMEAGKIDDVIVDIEQGQAFALFEARNEFAGTDGRFVVPLDKFEVGSSKADVIATTLSRTDLSAVQPADERLTPTGRTDTTGPYSYPARPRTTTTTTTTEGATDPVSTPARTAAPATTPAVTETGTPRSRLTESATSSTELGTAPTGRTGSEREPSSISGDLTTATSSIRSALQSDTSLAKENVQVSTSEGKITLRGTVQSEEIKKRAEEVARRASQSAEIDNQLRVEN